MANNTQPRTRCKICKGEYSPTTADGQRYFHACAPAVLVTVTRAGADIEVLLSKTEAGDVVKSRRDVTRSNARDENVIASGSDKGKPKQAAADRSDVVAFDAPIDAPIVVVDGVTP